MDRDPDTSKHARELAVLGASKGGTARAEALSQEERSEIASRAARARWGNLLTLPRETHGGVLQIGEVEIPCAVLDNGVRVLSTRGVTRAFGGKKTGTIGKSDGAPQMPPFLASASIKPFISDDLTARLISPIQYRPLHGGRSAFGYEATLLPKLCDVLLEARDANALKSNQTHLSRAADVLVRGFAEVGIIALIDEATGYQDTRARDALAKILEAFVARELQAWVKTFPLDFYKELFRIRRIPFSSRPKRPKYIGHLTNDLVYARLAPGVLIELRKKNPSERGRRKHKHFQWLTADLGHPKLQQHLAAVTALMRATDTWESFKALLDKALPRFKHLPLLDQIEE